MSNEHLVTNIVVYVLVISHVIMSNMLQWSQIYTGVHYMIETNTLTDTQLPVPDDQAVIVDLS